MDLGPRLRGDDEQHVGMTGRGDDVSDEFSLYCLSYFQCRLSGALGSRGVA